MSESVDYKTKYEHLCTAVAGAVAQLDDVARLLELTAKRMTSSAANCASAARSIKHIEHALVVEARHE